MTKKDEEANESSWIMNYPRPPHIIEKATRHYNRRRERNRSALEVLRNFPDFFAMRLPGVLSFLLLSALLSPHHVQAFVPHRPTNVMRISSSMHALPPPVPPPPPPMDPNIVEQLVREASKVLENLQNLELPQFSVSGLASFSDFSSIQEQVLALKKQVEAYDPRVIEELSNISGDLQSRLLQEYPQIRPFFEKIVAFLEPLLQSPAFTVTVAASLTFMVANLILTAGQDPAPSKPYPSQRYDAETARAYFDRRLPVALARGLDIALQSAQFGLGLLSDKLKYVSFMLLLILGFERK
jgi:hypothetical protein